MNEFRTGTLAVVGRPNVGKSTLTNRLVGAKVSITSSKPQTTRHRIRGVVSIDNAQLILVDTPGFQSRSRSALNRLMNRNITQALAEVDVVLFVVEAGRWEDADRAILTLLPKGSPVLLVVNKIDRLAERSALLPYMDRVSKESAFAEILPVSAESGQGLDRLLEVAARYVPPGVPIFAEDEITDRSERFLAAEILREKLFRNLGQELPYGIAVEIEKFETEADLRRIHAAVIVEREAHKGIVIGKAGERLKRMSTDARRDMEKLFGGKVWLETWVKVRRGWAEDERILKSLGYE